jgi:hypothetical protein
MKIRCKHQRSQAGTIAHDVRYGKINSHPPFNEWKHYQKFIQGRLFSTEYMRKIGVMHILRKKKGIYHCQILCLNVSMTSDAVRKLIRIRLLYGQLF